MKDICVCEARNQWKKTFKMRIKMPAVRIAQGEFQNEKQKLRQNYSDFGCGRKGTKIKWPTRKITMFFFSSFRRIVSLWIRAMWFSWHHVLLGPESLFVFCLLWNLHKIKICREIWVFVSVLWFWCVLWFGVALRFRFSLVGRETLKFVWKGKKTTLFCFACCSRVSYEIRCSVVCVCVCVSVCLYDLHTGKNISSSVCQSAFTVCLSLGHIAFQLIVFVLVFFACRHTRLLLYIYLVWKIPSPKSSCLFDFIGCQCDMPTTTKWDSHLVTFGWIDEQRPSACRWCVLFLSSPFHFSRLVLNVRHKKWRKQRNVRQHNNGPSFIAEQKNEKYKYTERKEKRRSRSSFTEKI